MKRFFILCLIALISCHEKSVEKNTEKFQQQNYFEISGTLQNLTTNKVFLNKIIENSLYPIDSSEVLNNTFFFKGFVEYPERFAFTFQNYAASTILIIENTSFEVQINGENLKELNIKGSPLNELMKKYQTDSKNIFQKISYFFPQFQKARLENDAEKLQEINHLITEIVNDHQEFTFSFIKKHQNSYIAPMILRDLLKQQQIDTLKLKSLFGLFSENVKKTPDAQIIASELQLH